MNTCINTYEGHFILKLEPNQIFVFGSNTQGRHGKGAAHLAYKHFGAIYGQARGIQGQCYAICTKDLTKEVHPSISQEDIIKQIGFLYHSASGHLKEYVFLVAYNTASNLNGYTNVEMAIMFAKAGPIPPNILFNKQFAELIIASLQFIQTETK